MSYMVSDFYLGIYFAIVVIAFGDFLLARLGKCIAAYKKEREKREIESDLVLACKNLILYCDKNPPIIKYSNGITQPQGAGG